MKTKNILIVILAVLICSCSYDKKPDTAEKNESKKTTFSDNSRTSLDWAGTYSGILPCADCEGIKMSITLKNDLTYEREMEYLGKNSATYKSKGIFKWNEEGSKITLISDKDEKPNQYLVGENKLVMLDLNGNRIEGNLESKYILEKE